LHVQQGHAGTRPEQSAIAATSSSAGDDMNLIVWLPALFVLGLLTMGALFAFLYGCARI
jgi:hypothetical protein